MSRWLLAVLLLAAGLWLNTRNNRFPYYYHPDEEKKVEQILTGERNFNHPLLMLSTVDAVWKISGEPAEPQRVVNLGRWVSAIFASLGTMFFAMAAWSWRGGLAGVLTGVLLTLNHQVFELAHYMKEDPALYLGVGMFAWMVILYWQKPGAIRALTLGAAVGLAFSGKYLGIILLIPAVALIVSQAKSKKMREIAWLFFGLVLIFSAINFPLFANIDTFQTSFSKEMDWALKGQKELTRRVPHSIYLNIFVRNTTPVIWILLGLFLYQLWQQRKTKDLLAWCLLGTLFGWLLLLSFSPKTNDRYFLPLTGLVYLLTGAGAVSFYKQGWFCTRTRVAFLAILFASGAAWDGARTMRFAEAFSRDDRADLTAWIIGNIPATETIAYDARVNLPDEEEHHELANPLPHRLFRETFVADIGTRNELLGKGVNYVIISESSYGRFFLDSLRPKAGQDLDFERRAAFYRELKTQQPIWKRDRSEVLYLHPGLEVYALAR